MYNDKNKLKNSNHIYLFLGSWEFVIDFHTPTVDVPVLPDKKLYIDKELSFTIWLKTNNLGSNHYFSYPRIETSSTRITQLFTTSTKLCVRVKVILLICIEYGEYKRKWTHAGFVFNEDQNGELTSKAYINGKFFKSAKLKWRLGNPSNEFYEGFVLGNDVDWANINDPNQFADAEMSELYMYNRVLTNDEIISAFYHKAPVEGRIISWEEFSTTLDGKTDVSIKPYPKEFFR